METNISENQKAKILSNLRSPNTTVREKGGPRRNASSLDLERVTALVVQIWGDTLPHYGIVQPDLVMVA